MDKEACIKELSGIITNGNCSLEHLKEMGKNEDAEILKNKIEALRYAKKTVEKS